MAQLYSNENFPYEVVIALREFGHDVLTALDAGNANVAIPDEMVLEFATQNNRILLTLNRWDFVRLHRINTDHAGIIVCTQDDDTMGQAERIHHALVQASHLRGQLIRINRPQK
jgi:predicted nuclease of predicted toxin-antitoxin system